jgi:hypothetical protein
LEVGAVTNTILWVGIDTNGPIQRFTRDGMLIGSWGASGASGVAVDGAGHVYTAVFGGSGSTTITKYDAAQNVVSTINFPAWVEDMTYGGNNTLWIATNVGIVYHINSTGAILSQFNTGFQIPGIATDGSLLYITDGVGGSGVIQKRAFDGTILGSFSTAVGGDLLSLGYDPSDGTLWAGSFGKLYHFSLTGTPLGSLSTNTQFWHDGLEVSVR